MSVKQRLIEFAKSQEKSVRAFEMEVGLTVGYINAIRVSIQPDKIQSIVSRYPRLNTEWLLTGEGNMLKENLQVGDDNGQENLYFKGANPDIGEESLKHNAMDRNLLELMKGQQSQMERVLSQQDELISIIKNLTSPKGKEPPETESEKKLRPGLLGKERGELETNE